MAKLALKCQDKISKMQDKEWLKTDYLTDYSVYEVSVILRWMLGQALQHSINEKTRKQ